jgi:UDP-glucose 4-epimerase
MSKAISERLITSQCIAGKRSVNYLCVRYGNVLESRGSIIPLFKHQIKNSSELTVTDPNMTRFIMTLDQSVNLILNTLKHGNSGETWVPKLPSMKIIDLAEIFSQMFNKKIKIVGIRPGEKIHEDLLNDSEITRTRLTNVYGDYYVLNSSILATQSFKDLNNAYTSNNKESLLDKDQLHSLLVKYGVLNMQLEDFHGRKIEEILDASVVSLGENK